MKQLPLKFYQRDTKKVARELLGKRLCHFKNGRLTSGIIIETEAYLGLRDLACHSFGGRRTARVETMYLPGGHAYVYMIYGIHFCFNVVTQNPHKPEAVLIRALWPVEGIELMRKRRGIDDEKRLCSGPGKLCEALGIKKEIDGNLLRGPQIWIQEDYSYAKLKRRIIKRPRVGIDYAGEAKHWPLRFSINTDDLK